MIAFGWFFIRFLLMKTFLIFFFIKSFNRIVWDLLMKFLLPFLMSFFGWKLFFWPNLLIQSFNKILLFFLTKILMGFLLRKTFLIKFFDKIFLKNLPIMLYMTFWWHFYTIFYGIPYDGNFFGYIFFIWKIAD